MKQSNTKQFYIVLFLLINTSLIFAQTDSTKINLPKKKQKKYNLTFRLDNTIKELNFKNTFHYEGEYLANSFAEHTWLNYDSIIIDNNEVSRSNNFKFDLMVSIIEPLNIGLRYHYHIKQTRAAVGQPSDSTFSNFKFYPFFALAGVVDYKIAIKPVKRLYINPTLAFGTYQSEGLFTGVGKEWYADIKLAVLYNIGNHFGIRLYADYGNWLYREKSKSKPFPDKSRIVKSNVSAINFGAGLSYRFFLIPD